MTEESRAAGAEEQADKTLPLPAAADTQVSSVPVSEPDPTGGEEPPAEEDDGSMSLVAHLTELRAAHQMPPHRCCRLCGRLLFH